ncbi:MAG: YfhO family protein [Lachnospiraceae bacterium]|nr:YfhO family protein [Lachnospiraceae bacterium]
MTKKSKLITGLLAFIIPVIADLIGMYITGIYPVSTRSYMSIDGKHQYLPFFCELVRKLSNGESLFYSLRAGLGLDFYAIFSYYLTSPLNLIALIMAALSGGSYVAINEALTVLVLIKTGLTGLTMSYYVSKRSDNSYFALLLGLMYGMSNYVIGYHINLMWMDAVYLLPLLIYALEQMSKTYKGCLYSLLLALVIICNYYIAFGLAVYLCLYMAYLIIEGEVDIKKSIKSFILYSLLGGALSGIIIIPAAFNLLGTNASGTVGNINLGIIASPLKIFRQMLVGTKACLTTDDGGAANIYCGTVVLVFILGFIVSKNINKRQKIAGIFLLAIMFLSLNIGLINGIFHGMHEAYGFPNRHAFMIVFTMLMLSMKYLMSIKDLKKPVIVIICILTAIELFSSAIISIKANGNTDRSRLKSREDFLLSNENYKEYLKNPTSRMAINGTLSHNESLIYGNYDISAFASTMSDDTVNAMSALGYNTSLNMITYQGYTDLTNELLGVRYRLDLKRLSNINPYSNVTSDDIIVKTSDKASLAYYSDFASDERLNDNNPFVNQNFLLKNIIGYALYTNEELKLDKNQILYKADVNKNCHYYMAVVKKDDSSQYDKTELELKSVSVGELKNNKLENAKTYEDDLLRIYDLGILDYDTLAISLDTACCDDYGVYIGYYSEEEYSKTVEMLENNAVQIDLIDDKLVIKRSADIKGKDIFISIPYSKGLKAVDERGISYELSKTSGLFTKLKLMDNEEHTITISYRPEGFYPGLIITLISIFIIAIRIRNDYNGLKIKTGDENEG